VASGVDDVHHFLIPRKLEWVEEIVSEIEDVERKPSDGEDERNRHQQAVLSAQALYCISQCKNKYYFSLDMIFSSPFLDKSYPA